MNKSVTKSIAFLACTLFVVLFAFTSCSDDIILEPLDTLLGDYNGNYRYTDLSQGGSGVTRVDVNMFWRFTDNQYFLDDSTTTMCSPSGTYELTGDGLNLNQGFRGTEVCDSTLSPYGQFSVRRPDDSVILSQQVGDIFIEIKLKRQ